MDSAADEALRTHARMHAESHAGGLFLSKAFLPRTPSYHIAIAHDVIVVEHEWADALAHESLYDINHDVTDHSET